MWGCVSLLAGEIEASDDIIKQSAAEVLKSGFLKRGDLVVVTAGDSRGFTHNTTKIEVVRL